MLQILSSIAPIFGLIVVGYAASKTGYMSHGAGRVVSEFAFKVVMPALLFRAMLSIGELPVSPLWLAAAYFFSVVAVWTGTALAARVLLRRAPPDRPAIAMATTFGNGVMLGFPLILAAFGPDAATPMAILAVCDSIMLWMLGILHMEIALRNGARLDLRALIGVLGDVGRNPLVVALLSGAALRMAGVRLPPVPARLVEMMAQAGAPVALIGLGLALATYQIRGEARTIALISVIKLLITPAVGLVVAAVLVPLPALWSAVLVTFLAMPVGGNAFLFASRYDRAAAPVSASVAISTVLSAITLTLVIAVLRAA